MILTDTIAAIATAPGDSGIGIVRVSGENSIRLVDSVFTNKNGRHILDQAKSHTIHYGYILSKDDEKIDEVLVSVFRAPKSYTAEDTVEINCHGGYLTIKKVINIVVSAGARLAEPGEFTKRAFFNGRIDLSEAEAVMDLIQSKNEMARKSSFDQLRGDLSEKIKQLRSDIIYEVAFIESALDDPEHINLDGYQEKLSLKLFNIMKQIKDLLSTVENGRMIKDGISTVIVGKPNAGKSSILNMMLGQDRAIVTDIAGTTRDTLEESYQFRNIQLNIIDTAGIRDTTDPVEIIGVERARKYAKDADLILYVVDSSVDLDDNDREIMSFIKDKKVIFLLNKSDLNAKTTLENIREYYCSINELENKNSGMDMDEFCVVYTSAIGHQGLAELENAIESMFFNGMIKKNDEIVITNIRHKEALEQTLNSLKLVNTSMEKGLPEDFYTIDLMDAYGALGKIIGEEIGDDLVEEIFSKFCMGK